MTVGLMNEAKVARYVVKTTPTGIAKIVHRDDCRHVDVPGGLFTPYIDFIHVNNLKGWGVKMCAKCKPLGGD